MNLKNLFLKISLKEQYFVKIFLINLILVTFFIILFGPRNHGYMASLEGQYNGFRPIGYPLILHTLSLFLNYELIRYSAIFINGIFFSFIFSSICVISKNCNSNSYLNHLIFFFFLCPLFYEIFAIRETLLYAFLTILILINFYKWEKRSTFYGLILGLLFITRPSGLVGIFSFILISSYILLLKKNKTHYLKCFLNTFFWFLIIAIISIGIIYLKFNVLVFSSSCTSGLNIFKGLSSIKSMAYIFSDLDGIDKYLNYTQPSICNKIDYFKDLNKNLIADITIFEFIKSFIIKINFFFFSYLPVGSADLTLIDKSYIQVNNFNFSIFRIIVSFIGMILSILALIILIIRYSKKILNTHDYFIVFYCLGHAVIYSIAWPEARFRFPIDPILLIYLLFPFNDKNTEFINIFILLNRFIKKIFKN